MGGKKMEYPKPVMRKNELLKMGHAEAQLMRIYREKGSPVAWKLNPGTKNGNSPIVFNTEELEKVIARENGTRR